MHQRIHLHLLLDGRNIVEFDLTGREGRKSLLSLRLSVFSPS